MGVKVQRKRQGCKNAILKPDEILEYCKLTEDVNNFLLRYAEKYEFSPRAISSCIKISRTIADMEESEMIKIEHMNEAIELRKNEGGMCI
jgi:magnesium chelatase family protein